jgi:hypothetical protein
MQPNGTTDRPPIEYPTVTIGGRTYVVKFSQFAEYLVSKWGYRLSDLVQIIVPGSGDNPRNLSFIVQLFAACVAHNFSKFTPPQEPLTPEQWMEAFPEDDPDLWANIGKAVGLALVKRLSDRAAKVGPNPTVMTENPTPVQ